MSPGDPSEKLPCDDVLEALWASRGEMVGVLEVVNSAIEKTDRRIAALTSCRSRCRIQNTTAG